ncbi:tyrosyl-DNA phosphodiesterase-domain-containing protein [Mycena rosella]|uniref:Tyrosyl-DNA phosphodiesterase-domain-containing protein n=1 Tax=Mycena rosella TaxID=1033263 RepID=A0AAD7DAH2_MYCRO|nr:tyrosyl-DNA phosphodiesterase-domain-containing protein [Mycena rosella]
MAASLVSYQLASKRRLLPNDSEPPRKKLQSTKQLKNEELAEEYKILQAEKRDKAANPIKVPMKYAGGALRLTRTPGRSTVNTVSLKDLIRPYELRSAFVFSFFIEDDHLFQHFPFKRPERKDPGRPHCLVYVGRDISQDMTVAQCANLKTKRPKGDAEWDRVIAAAQENYQELYGRNFRAFYPRKNSGCMHSKLMVLIYPDFLRVVITSANFMELDVILGDNHWFIQDFPRLSEDAAQDYTETSFERELIQHMEDLGCPDEFLDLHLRVAVFDFSAAKVYLVTSKPGNYSGEDARKYGQLRLRHVVRNKILKCYEEEVPKMMFEVCVGSVGKLEAEDVVKNLLESCAGGRQKSKRRKPALKMMFPTYDDVQNSRTPGVGNISSHINWKMLDENSASHLKDIFYHYRSTDTGTLFHMKSILALHADAPATTPPLYMYVGSANFSAGAWGRVRVALRKNCGGKAPLRVEGLANFECGVVVKGGDIAGMLETGNWGDIVPYMRPSDANKYQEGERPYKASAGSAAIVMMDGEEEDKEGEDEDYLRAIELVNCLLERAAEGGGVLHLTVNL